MVLWMGSFFPLRLRPGIWVCVGNARTSKHGGAVNGLLDTPPSFKGSYEWCTEMSVTIPKDRDGGKAAAPAGDRFLSPSWGFYTWFNMLPGEFGSILHSGLPCHSHFKSNCWPGRNTWEKKPVMLKIHSRLLNHCLFLSVGINVNDMKLHHSLSKQAFGQITNFHWQNKKLMQHFSTCSNPLQVLIRAVQMGTFY